MRGHRTPGRRQQLEQADRVRGTGRTRNGHDERRHCPPPATGLSAGSRRRSRAGAVCADSPYPTAGDPLREDEPEEHDADDAVHREKRRIQPRQIIALDQRMLVAQEHSRDRDAGIIEPAAPDATPTAPARRWSARAGPARPGRRSILRSMRAASATRAHDRTRHPWSAYRMSNPPDHAATATAARRASTRACSNAPRPRGTRPPGRSRVPSQHEMRPPVKRFV